MNQKQWWYNRGSGIIPRKDDDMESFAKRISEVTWSAAMSASIGIDLAKPGDEQCMRVWVDADGNLKFENIPISRIMKSPEEIENETKHHIT